MTPRRLALALALTGVAASAALAADAPAAPTAAAPSTPLEAFRHGDYPAAADGWRAALAETPKNPDRWYALGTAEARAGRLGHAVHAFEQALLLRPGDADAEHNLAAVRGRIVEQALARGGDKRAVLPGDDDAGTSLLTALSPWALGLVFAVAWALLFALLWVARRTVRAGLRTAATFGAVICGLVSLATGGLLVGRSVAVEDRLYGVVADPSPARQGPGERYPAVADVLPGVKVRLGGEEGAWRQIILPDGGGAWMPADRVLPLQRP